MPMTIRRQERSDDEMRIILSPSQSPEARVSCYEMLSDGILQIPLFFEQQRHHQDRKRRKMDNAIPSNDPKQGQDDIVKNTMRRWRPANIDTSCHEVGDSLATTCTPPPPPAPRNSVVQSAELATESPCSVVPNDCTTHQAFTVF